MPAKATDITFELTEIIRTTDNGGILVLIKNVKEAKWLPEQRVRFAPGHIIIPQKLAKEKELI